MTKPSCFFGYSIGTSWPFFAACFGAGANERSFYEGLPKGSFFIFSKMAGGHRPLSLLIAYAGENAELAYCLAPRGSLPGLLHPLAEFERLSFPLFDKYLRRPPPKFLGFMGRRGWTRAARATGYAETLRISDKYICWQKPFERSR